MTRPIKTEPKDLTDEQLAMRLALCLNLSFETATEVIESKDPGLGRDYAVDKIEREEKFAATMDRLTQHSQDLKAAARYEKPSLLSRFFLGF